MMNKNSFRAICLKRLEKASKNGAFKKDKTVLDSLYQLVNQYKSKKIMLYIPLGTEVNINSFIRRLRREKKELYVPFMEGKSFRLVKYRLPLEKKQFGIKEPKDSKYYKKEQIDLAIVPVIGFDSTLRRIGFGKGMYDRFYEKEHKRIKKTVFIARDWCYSKKEITDDYDIKADRIITPQYIY